MFNEFQLEIVAVAVAVFVLVLYFMMRKGSEPRTPDIKIETKERSTAPIKKETELVSESKKEQTPIVEQPLSDSANRRKSDRVIPKRAAPDHVKITKENFSEFAGERILVAEDNPINQKVIMGLLAESGIELVMANDGQEALDILENDPNFVMILMDAHMPRVDGLEATRMIRKNPRYDHILVVALSGDTASDDIQKMKDAGMDEQLAKPLRMDALYKIIYAYALKERKNEENVAVVIGSKNLDIAKGIETCGGDENFYREIVSEFVADYSDSSDRLGEFLRTDNFTSADALLLDIIGISENIGAHALGTSATNMKLAMRDTDERSYFSLYDQYRANLEKLLLEIKEYL